MAEGDGGPTRVVIVGGGAAGVITAAHLLRAADDRHPLDVSIIERRPAIGPGLAYGTSHPLHTLNNFAGRMSAIDGDPDHLLRWCADHGHPTDSLCFLPRELYGRYLTSVLDTTRLPPGSRLSRHHGIATDLRTDGPALSVQLASGRSIPADQVVLALGNPPPRRQPGFEGWGGPLRARPLGGASGREPRLSPEVALLGTGLTMVDIVAKLHQSSPGARFTAVSRHGLLPSAHNRSPSPPHDTFHPGAGSLDALLESVQAGIAELAAVGGDWRAVVDSVRSNANALWHGFTLAEQDRFVTWISRRWEIVRHRMSPDMAAHLRGLQQSGRLRIARVGEVELAGFDRIINCTGPAPVPTRGWNPLVDALLERGSIRPHRLGLGLDLDPDGRVVDKTGRPHPAVYAVGAARKGIEWEVGAVPDLRDQAAHLAARLVRVSVSRKSRTP